MPKEGQSISAKYYIWVKEFGEAILSTDGTVILCKICDKQIKAGQRCQINQHFQTSFHQTNVNRKKSEQQLLISQGPSSSSSTLVNDKGSQFAFDICQTFLSSGIPMNKLNNPHLREFLKKWTNRHIPSESLVRKKYVDICHSNDEKSIQREFSGEKIWLSIDETTDARGGTVACVLAGVLNSESYVTYFSQ